MAREYSYRKIIHWICLVFLCPAYLMAACNPQPSLPVIVVTPTPGELVILPTPTQINPVEPTPGTRGDYRVYIQPGTPVELKKRIEQEKNLKVVSSSDQVDYVFGPIPYGENQKVQLAWVYVAAVPFPTTQDEISFDELILAWRSGNLRTVFDKPILLDEATLALFTEWWGPPDPDSVRVIAKDQLLTFAWEESPSLVLLPFEELEPRWKVLRLDGASPYLSNFDLIQYPLQVPLGFKQVTGEDNPIDENLPSYPSNYDPEKITRLIMTGTTALVRHTALKMEENGVLYPAENIGELLRSADLTHISNEIPFYDRCPPAVPVRVEMRFCSDPTYFQLLDNIGVDLVELTGNHILDWGPEALLQTLEIYRQNNLPFYGGGYDQQAAQKPLLLEHHGNKLAFLGCNRAGPDNIWAGEETPGAALCDFEYLKSEIDTLISDGYLPIVTFQHYEVDDFMPMNLTRLEFLEIANAGAVIVSGSQAHFPHGFMFEGSSFLHFGLGNLFFDQMTPYNRWGFIDQHIFYDGKYLGVDLYTTILEDYSQPTLMDPEERETMLQKYFEISGWIPQNPQ